MRLMIGVKIPARLSKNNIFQHPLMKFALLLGGLQIWAMACGPVIGGKSLLAAELRNPSLNERYEDLKNLSTTAGPRSVRDTLTLSFADFRATFFSGQVLPLVGRDGQPAGFLFSGAGEVLLTPRHRIERFQLKRFAHDTTFATQFDFFALRAVGGRVPAQWLASLPAQGGGAFDQAAVAFASQSEASFLEKAGFNLPARLLAEALFSESDFAFCAFRGLDDNPAYPATCYYVYDPRVHEKVQFYQYRPHAIGSPFYTLCSYPLGDYLEPVPDSPTRITQYNGWLALDRDGVLQADLGVDIFTGATKLTSAYFQLSDLAEVRTVVAENGDTLDFVKEKNEQGLTVFWPKGELVADTLRLLFNYRGKFLNKNQDGNWHLREKLQWHPRLGYLRRARYKLIYKYPSDLELIASGELVRDWIDRDMRLNYYVQNTPAKAALFALGSFHHRGYWGPDSTRINLYATRFRGANMLRNITGDVASSLYYFTRNLTPYKYKKLTVLETPGFESQGFPGFITLTWVSFRTEYEGIMEALRSHEVAHQWWGNEVGWRSYRDQWLSEGFAEYMGALYLALAIPGRHQFEDLLQAWRDDILDRGSFGVSLGLRRFGFSKDALRKSNIENAGPIYLGIRLGQDAPSNYYLLVYEKSAYLMHMLRAFFTDDRTGSDETFWALLREYLAAHAGDEPSTLDFIAMVSKYAGQDMRWFFDQWLLASEIPEYEYTYGMLKTAAGFYLNGSVEQKNVPASFRADIPVAITFEAGDSMRERITTRASKTEFSFGPFRNKPVQFEFNSGNVILSKSRGGKTDDLVLSE